MDFGILGAKVAERYFGKKVAKVFIGTVLFTIFVVCISILWDKFQQFMSRDELITILRHAVALSILCAVLTMALVLIMHSFFIKRLQRDAESVYKKARSYKKKVKKSLKSIDKMTNKAVLNVESKLRRAKKDKP